VRSPLRHDDHPTQRLFLRIVPYKRCHGMAVEPTWLRHASHDSATSGGWTMTPREQREHLRRMRIRLAALERHRAARDPATGKSTLAVTAGRASAKGREGDQVWGLRLALKRWHGIDGHLDSGTSGKSNPPVRTAGDNRELTPTLKEIQRGFQQHNL
jgi:hypothetical protein